MHLLILGLLIVLSSATSNIPIIWNITLQGDYGVGISNSVIKSDDGGYVIAGYNYQGPNTLTDVWVIKINANGNSEWYRTFDGGYGNDSAYSIIKLNDGYLIVGSSFQGSSNHNDVWVIKIDANGDHVWNRTFHGGYASDVGRSVIKSDDGGYVIAGKTYQGPNTQADVWVIKIDANGDHVWNRTFHGGYGPDWGYSITKSDDGGYVITGYSYQGPNTLTDVWVIKIDANGDHVWNRTFHGGYGKDVGYYIIKSNSGGYVVVGYMEDSNNNNNLWIINIDTNGNHVSNISLNNWYGEVRNNFSSNVSNNDYWINLTLDNAISWNVTLVVDGVDV
ncbi:MAG: hypothetical protein QW690_03055, partial [Candidatus Anstonellales archaeon]